MASYHKSNLGRFGDNLPSDMDGYVHTTISEWMDAPVDFGGMDMTRSQLREWARGQASESRDALRESEKALGEWRQA